MFAGDPVADGDFEILGQRISAAGARVGPTFPISNSGAGNDSFQPAAAYHPKRNEYLVTFQSDQLNGSDNEIYGQRLSATGTEIGGDFRISNAGDQGANHEADRPAIAFDGKRGSYLVAFESEGLATDGEQEIFAQRVSATGAQIGGDQRVSTVGADGDTNRDADFAGIAYNRKRDQFLVVFEANALSSPAEQEIFGQRLTGPGAPIGGIIGVSNAGPEGDPNYEAVSPTVAYGAKRDNYLVTFHGENFASPGAGEIFAQRISSAGVAQGGDVQVSFSGAATEIARSVELPRVAYSNVAGEFFVTWDGEGLPTLSEQEVFGQRVAAGGRLLDGNVRLSIAGADGDAGRFAVFSAVGASTTASRYLTVWAAEDLPTDDEYEVFGRLTAAPRCGGRAATVVGTAGKDKLKGTKKSDVIVGLGGGDVLKGLGGGDFLCGGAGKDKLAGGKQKDRLVGGAGRDSCSGGAAKDRARSCERSAAL